ncbi:hypothetical protein PGTUg99_016212 [Puccinia graminis f. sp. tritici]|uniref:Uncharacterized protein n=1 Tax=Puccinia graminis f. sp. tritici TaxID=56615 RepID=A0A5B0NAU7_PUCGR|nr:hypothetical protein PGTUg99_016212 [Puccinia graminis f. sp. tritici]
MTVYDDCGRPNEALNILLNNHCLILLNDRFLLLNDRFLLLNDRVNEKKSIELKSTVDAEFVSRHGLQAP